MSYTEQEFLTAAKRRGAFQRFTYVKDDAAAGGKSATVTLRRVVTFTGRTGIAWGRIAANADRPIEQRKWGVRRTVYFVDHTPKSGRWAGTPQVYVTVLPLKGSFRTVYLVDNAPVTRAEYNAHRTASAVQRDGDTPAYMDLNLSSLVGMS